MSTYLLDANVAIALTVAEHEHHDRAQAWLAGVTSFALCPIVEGALIRFLLRVGESGRTAAAVLAQIRAHPRCGFWPADISYADVDVAGLRGHRQVTDTFLVHLAGRHGGLLATLDDALAAHWPDRVRLIP